jgi:HEAT repeat protein
VARRLVDSDAEVRDNALVAARLQQSEPIASAAIREYLSDLAQDSSRTIHTRRTALEALREIRDTAAIPLFIKMLDDIHSELNSEAQSSLSVLARTDLGAEARAWHKWWRANKERHRIEWLIDALMHEDSKFRRAAGDELKNVTKEYFGYYDDLPRKERAGAQARYLQWWEAKGRARFR